MTEAAPKHLWFVRTDKSKMQFLNAEAEAGRLRQGWGYKPEHDLSLYAEHKDKDKLGAAKGNLRMLKVKQGDWLVATNLPSRQQCTVFLATEDFKSGYTFDIATSNGGDYGHCFPVKKLFGFSVHAEPVDQLIRKTLKCRSRFWKKNNLIDDLVKLYGISQSDAKDTLAAKSTEIGRLNTAVEGALKALDLETLKDSFSHALRERLQASEWEFALVEILQSLYPCYTVTREGGRAEKEHGADILIAMPNPMGGEDLLIAVQVKDYKGSTGQAAFDQIGKSESYKDFSGRVIETWVIFTGIDKGSIDFKETSSVKVMGKKELNAMLLKYALNQASDVLSELDLGSEG